MRLGQAAMEALRAEITGCLKPGDELVVACPVALKGTSVIAKIKRTNWQRDSLPVLFRIVFHFGTIMEPAVLSGRLRRSQMPAHYMLWVRAAFKCALEDGRSFRSRTGSRLP